LPILYDGLDTATEVVAPSCNDGTLERPNCASSGRVAIKALIRDRAAELQKIEIFKTLLNKFTAYDMTYLSPLSRRSWRQPKKLKGLFQTRLKTMENR